jgi:hypothetical protein
VNRGIATAVAVLLAVAWGAPALADEPAAADEPCVISDPAIGSILIDQLVAISLPLQMDAGLTIHRRWFVGAYVQYAWSVLQLGGCSVGDKCSVTGLQAGLQATYAFRDGGGPWVGLGTGWEWMYTSFTGNGSTTKIDVSGWDFVIFQLGWDVEVSPGWKVGPWLSGSIGAFSRATRSLDGRQFVNDLSNNGLHGWLQLGVKGSFSL